MKFSYLLKPFIQIEQILILLFFTKSLQRYNFFMIPTIYSKEKSRHSL
ncbi:hypothetical protein BARVI_01210 [Barnesiella viscericola DSM 18177]|uniref:Uncharacterized protein n=1 Tax=Barnesiella viscericola DSM 18177 TaxID=880074 RepID=W0ES17_9BACT|nr:hypothetical protein BARVI_01210 [Barnesiella viscericola DSM 18177]